MLDYFAGGGIERENGEEKNIEIKGLFCIKAITYQLRRGIGERRDGIFGLRSVANNYWDAYYETLLPEIRDKYIKILITIGLTRIPINIDAGVLMRWGPTSVNVCLFSSSALFSQSVGDMARGYQCVYIPSQACRPPS